MKFDIAKFFFVGMALLLPVTAQAGNSAEQPVDSDEYYYGLDESNLRRDIVNIRHYYSRPVTPDLGGDETQDGYVYFGASGKGGFTGLWIPAATDLRASGRPDAPEWANDVRFGVDWRLDVPGAASANARRAGRSLAGSEFDRVGVRADVTALLFDNTGNETTAWRVSGALGSTSLSLVSSDPLQADAAEGDGGLLWDVGVGWTSGSVSLNAGYQSGKGVVRGNETDISVLSLGADYSVFPGLSVYGEFNVIDDQDALGDDRLGTVIILGTGLNF